MIEIIMEGLAIALVMAVALAFPALILYMVHGLWVDIYRGRRGADGHR